MTGEDRRLDRLMQYTLFHIGVYISMGTLVIGALAWDAREAFAEERTPYFQNTAFSLAIVALILLGVAGLCGGVVAARLPYATSMDEFLSGRIGFWPTLRSRLFAAPPRFFMALEHWAFWLALLFGASAALAATKRLDLSRVLAWPPALAFP